MNNWIAGNRYLSMTEQQNNARIITRVLRRYGWTDNAIAGLLGNTQKESTNNPGIWQSLKYGNTKGGYGLTQWTPATKYIEWAGADWETNHNKQLERLQYEVDNRLQFYATDDYPISFRQFIASTETPYYLACAFAWNYERSAVVIGGTEAQKEALRRERGGNAEKWYTFIKTIPEATTPPVWLLAKISERRWNR